MQAEGRTVAEECWRAAVPVQLRLADSELSSLEQPPVLYFLLPRQSYLHSLVPQALQMLQHLLPPGDLTPWFEHGHLPLKWGVPAGVLYDLLAAPTGELPWRLTIHFRGFPDRMLPAYSGEGALRSAFFNSLKEAACISRGSAQRVMEMAAAAQEDLWRQVLSSSLQGYRRIVGPLQLAPQALRGGGRQAAVPLRLFVRMDAGGYLSSYEDIASTSRPVEVQAGDGSNISLRQALLPLLAECLGGDGTRVAASGRQPESQPSTPLAWAGNATSSVAGSESMDGEPPPASDSEAASGAGQAAAASPAEQPDSGEGPAALAAAEGARSSLDAGGAAVTAAESLLEVAAAEGRLLVGGASPPLEAPLAWLHAHLHAGDYFLYVILHFPQAS